jgi:hypothetical protein
MPFTVVPAAHVVSADEPLSTQPSFGASVDDEQPVTSAQALTNARSGDHLMGPAFSTARAAAEDVQIVRESRALRT